jgi:hypothetical protein
MSEDEFQHEVLDAVAEDRRAFLKKMVVGAAFAVPAIASFNMSSLSAVSADAITANQRDLIHEACRVPEVQEAVAEAYGVKANQGQCMKALREHPADIGRFI